MPARASFRGVAGIALAVVAAGASLASLAGFAGSLWWGLDLFAHFRLQYAAALLACAAGFLGLRRWWSAVLCAPLLALNVALLAPLYLGEPAPAAEDAPRLRLLSFNVNAWNDEHGRLVGWLREQRADVILLTELRPGLLEKVQSALPGYRVVARPRGDSFGIAALARAPLAAGRIVHPGGGDIPSVEVVLDRDGARFALLGVHPPPPMTGELARERDSLLAGAAAWARERGERAVVFGDFNTTPWGHAFTALLDRGGLESSQRGFGYQATWPDGFWPLAVPIDHCLHGPGLTTLERGTGPTLGSDHRPLSVTLAPR